MYDEENVCILWSKMKCYYRFIQNEMSLSINPVYVCLGDFLAKELLGTKLRFFRKGQLLEKSL